MSDISAWDPMRESAFSSRPSRIGEHQLLREGKLPFPRRDYPSLVLQVETHVQVGIESIRFNLWLYLYELLNGNT